MFILHPPMILFLQNIDYRDKNDKITRNVLEKLYLELDSKMETPNTVFIHNGVLSLDVNCNQVFSNIDYMIWLWSISSVGGNLPNLINDMGIDDNDFILNTIKNFYDNFIFLLVYAGCTNLAQFLCDNYVELVFVKMTKNFLNFFPC